MLQKENEQLSVSYEYIDSPLEAPDSHSSGQNDISKIHDYIEKLKKKRDSEINIIASGVFKKEINDDTMIPNPYIEEILPSDILNMSPNPRKL